MAQAIRVKHSPTQTRRQIRAERIALVKRLFKGLAVTAALLMVIASLAAFNGLAS